MSFKKFLILLLIFAVIGGIYLNFGTGEDVIMGADDFEVQTPFSVNLFGSPCKNENNFIVKDDQGNTLNIEKLDEGMFKNIVSSDFKNEGYSLYGVRSFDEENNLYIYDVDDMIGLVEVGEVDGNKYKIIIGDLSGNSLLNQYYDESYYKSSLREWREYLIHFNDVNNVNVLRLNLVASD